MSDNPQDNPSGFKFTPPLIIGLVVAGAVVLILLITLVFIPQPIISQGKQLESGMSANYADGANYLSNCVVKTKRAAQVTTAQTAAVDKVLKDAVSGRYGSGNTMDKAKLFSSIVENYPEAAVATLNKTFQDMLAIVTGCQDDFRNKQSTILDGVRQFNSWRTGSWSVRTFGGSNFPDTDLYITLPGINLTGRAAMVKMSTPIVDGDTVGAYQNGVQDTTDPFATPTPTK